jgi:hypothetical protein
VPEVGGKTQKPKGRDDDLLTSHRVIKEQEGYKIMIAQQVHDEIVAYMVSNFGSDYIKSWYVGITSDVEERLFKGHNVDQASKGWVWRQAFDVVHARSAEAMLLNRGHDGGGGGGNHATIFVYAFRKDLSTVR